MDVPTAAAAAAVPLVRQPPRRSPDAGSPFRARRRLLFLLPIAIGVLAFAIRLGVLVRGGGLAGIGGYDDGVYYAAGDALVHGRLPYADFLFLHPPGVVLASAPFAALGALTSDTTGFIAARLGFELIGGLNAALIVLMLRRSGFVASLVGGVLAAVLMPAVWAERSVLLEPLGTLGILLGLLLLSRSRSSRHLVVLAGVAAGWSADVKIWYVAPIAVVALVGTRHPIRFLLGALAAVAVVWIPFLVAAPGAMVREVVTDQLGRPRRTGSIHRLAGILMAHPAGGLDLRAVTLVLTALAAAALVVALLTPGARVFGALLAVDAAVLLSAPSWFEHYGALTAPPLALCAGVAVQRVANRMPLRRWSRPALGVAVAGAVLAGGLHVVDRSRSGVAVPVAFVHAVQRTPGCITADDPGILVLTDALSRDLARPGCRVWPDVTGWTYDAADRRDAAGNVVPRTRNEPWQHLVVGYLRSGDATIEIRRSTGLNTRSRALLDNAAPLFRDGPDVLRPLPVRARA